MRALLLAAVVLGLAAAPLALPTAAATTCGFIVPSLAPVVCRPFFILFCVGQQWIDGPTPKGIASCVLA